MGQLGTSPSATIPDSHNAGDFGSFLVGAPHRFAMSAAELQEHKTDGHMDIDAVRAGAILVCPVKVPGGGVYMGDMHALQGDGEIAGHTCDVSGTVTLQVEVLKGLGDRRARALPRRRGPAVPRPPAHAGRARARARPRAPPRRDRARGELPVSVVGTGPDLNSATDNGLARAAELLDMTVPEVRNRATIAGAIEIGRHPGVVQVTFRAPGRPARGARAAGLRAGAVRGPLRPAGGPRAGARPTLCADARGPRRSADRSEVDRHPRARDAPGRRAQRRALPADRPRDRPLPRGPRGPHAARGLRGARERQPAGHARAGRVRVVPNLYPALDPEGEAPAPFAKRDLFTATPARGSHEVVINAPQPVHSLAELDGRPGAAAVDVWRDRMRAHAEEAAYVHVIVNERREAGASLPHTHAQIYALDFVPAAVARERERFGAYAQRTMGGNLLQDLVQEEVKLGDRIVAIDDEAVLMVPYGARFPYQLMLAPRRPRPRFDDDGPTGAALLHDALSRLARRARGEPAAEPVGPDGPARRRPLLLAHRHRAAPHAHGRPRARHRRAPQHRRAGARGRRAAGGVMRALVQRVSRAAVRVDGERRRARSGRAARPARRHPRRHRGRLRPPRRQGPRAARVPRRGRPDERAARRPGGAVRQPVHALRRRPQGQPPELRRGRPPERAEPLYERFCARLGAERGVFGAMMEVELVNDGPVTLLLEAP